MRVGSQPHVALEGVGALVLAGLREGLPVRELRLARRENIFGDEALHCEVGVERENIFSDGVRPGRDLHAEEVEVTKKKLPLVEVMHFSRQLSAFVRAGIPLIEALMSEAGVTYRELAATKEGKITGLKVRTIADHGYSDAAADPSKFPAGLFNVITGSYDFPNAFVEVDGVYTNKPPGGVAYRCSFRVTEAVHAMERITDVLGHLSGNVGSYAGNYRGSLFQAVPQWITEDPFDIESDLTKPARVKKSWIRLPYMAPVDPPTSSGVTYSPTVGMKTMKNVARAPGRLIGRTTRRNV